MALRTLAEAPPLVAALERFGPLYQEALAERFLWRLGLQSQGLEADTALIGEAERHMREGQLSPDAFFHRHRQGRNPPDGSFGEALRGFAPEGADHPLWAEDAPPSLVIERVEAIWSAIADHDDWQPLAAEIAAIRRLGEALSAH